MTRRSSRSALWFPVLVGLLLNLGPQSAEASSAEERRKEQKVRAEVRQLIKRLSNANEQSLEEISRRFVELNGDGMPVKRILCEAIVSQNEKGAQNGLSVLETISPETAQSARILISIEPAAAATPGTMFDHYTRSFEELRKDGTLDAAFSPVVVGVLLRLAKVGNAVRGDSAERDVQRKAYNSGVELLFSLALRDDDAYGDLLKLAALRSPGHGEELIRWQSVNRVGRAAGPNAERAKAALPVLMGALRVALNPPVSPRDSVALRSLTRATHNFRALSVLNEIGELGPHAAPAARQIRPLVNQPALSSAAKRALAKIQGGN